MKGDTKTRGFVAGNGTAPTRPPDVVKLPIGNFEQLFAELDRWRHERLGARHETDEYTAKLIQREVDELRDAPTELQEMADVLFCLMAHVWNQGLTPQEFLEGCKAKLAVLWTRDYSAIDENGVHRHT